MNKDLFKKKFPRKIPIKMSDKFYIPRWLYILIVLSNQFEPISTKRLSRLSHVENTNLCNDDKKLLKYDLITINLYKKSKYYAITKKGLGIVQSLQSAKIPLNKQK